MDMSIRQALLKNFMGIPQIGINLLFFLFNYQPTDFFFFVDPFVAGWLLVVEFIFYAGYGAKCYRYNPDYLLLRPSSLVLAQNRLVMKLPTTLK